MGGTQLSTAVKPQLGCVFVALGVLGALGGPRVPAPGCHCTPSLGAMRAVLSWGAGRDQGSGWRQAGKDGPCKSLPNSSWEGGVSGAPDPAAALVGANTP